MGLYYEDILDCLDNIDSFINDLSDESAKNTAHTLVKMTKQKVINFAKETEAEFDIDRD